MTDLQTLINMARDNDKYAYSVLAERYVKVLRKTYQNELLEDSVRKVLDDLSYEMVCEGIRNFLEREFQDSIDIVTFIHCNAKKKFLRYKDEILKNESQRGVLIRLKNNDEVLENKVREHYYNIAKSIIDKYSIDSLNKKIILSSTKIMIDEQLSSLIEEETTKNGTLKKYKNIDEFFAKRVLNKLERKLSSNAGIIIKQAVEEKDIDTYMYYVEKYKYIVDREVEKLDIDDEEEKEKIKQEGYNVLADAILFYKINFRYYIVSYLKTTIKQQFIDVIKKERNISSKEDEEISSESEEQNSSIKTRTRK